MATYWDSSDDDDQQPLLNPANRFSVQRYAQDYAEVQHNTTESFQHERARNTLCFANTPETSPKKGSYPEIHKADEDELVNEDVREKRRPSSSSVKSTEDEKRGNARKTLYVGLLCVGYVICFSMVRIVLPIYSGSTRMAGGDAFTVLLYICAWFPAVLATITILYKVFWDRTVTLFPAVRWSVLFLMGLMSLLNGFCSTFASPPTRTPPYLQGLLMTMRIPYTVLVRLALLRKGLSLRRFCCTVAVLIGIFITVEPRIWSLPGSGNKSTSGGTSTAAHIIWPVIFALGTLPAAVNTVICERELKKGEAQSLSFITWTQACQFLILLPLFWVDFIPFFGMAKSFDDFGQRMQKGISCNFSSASHCFGLVYKGWIFIIAYCLGNLFQFLLVKYSEGAVFAVVVQSMVTPLATLFWTFFNFDVETDYFYWAPQFTETTGFTVGGLLIIVPAVILYNVFSKEEAQQERQTKGRDKTDDRAAETA